MLAVFWWVFFFFAVAALHEIWPPSPQTLLVPPILLVFACSRQRAVNAATATGFASSLTPRGKTRPLAALLGRSAMLAGMKWFDALCTPGFLVLCAFIEHLASSTDSSRRLGQVITVIPISLVFVTRARAQRTHAPD